MTGGIDLAVVEIWGERVGVVAWDDDREFATFEYDPAFLTGNLDLAPVHMSLEAARRGDTRYSFRRLARETFMGLPGLLADSLPDRFGNQLIDVWLARQGRTPSSFSPVERLCYTGRRAMGALEFQPPLHGEAEESVRVEVAELVALAQAVIDERSRLDVNLAEGADSILDIIRVGTSAGGGRPKAVIALNDDSGEVRSGQVVAPPGFDPWILKFDGVQDRTLGDPAGYGRIEYAYHLMAAEAGILMPECRLYEEGERAHFMVRRFDRPCDGGKLHMQSLCAVGHFDFNEPGACSYEQAFQVMRELRLPYADSEQQFRRMVLNIAARNQDDHTKNIAFLMDRRGVWRLSPAFDVTYAYNPNGRFTSRHQMSVAGKREGFTRPDLTEMGKEMSINDPAGVLDEVVEAVSKWPEFAAAADVEDGRTRAIAATHRLRLG